MTSAVLSKSTGPEPAPRQRGRRRLWRRVSLVVLVLSLAINGFLGAVIARQLIARGEEQLSRLPAIDREIVRETISDQRPALRRVGQRLRAAEAQVRAAMSAQPFDAVTLEAALAEMRAANQAMHEQVHGIVLHVAPQLSTAGREAMARMDALRARRLENNR